MKLLRDPVLIVVVAAAAIYAAFANQYYLFLLTTGALTVIVGVGLNVLLGLTGQVSFGHVGFYALGAYTTAVLATKFGWNFWWTLPVAALLNGIIGALLGLVALRVRGPYLAMVTIAFGFVVEYSVVEWESLTGGQNGLMSIPYPSFGGLSIGERGISLVAIAIMGLVLVLYKRIAQSAWGLAMRAVRDSEIAAASMAVNPLTVRTVAFTISAVLAGIAGSFFASATTFVAPSSFPFFQSILFVLVVIVGGVERTYGPVIGAIIVVGIPELLSGLAEYRVLLSGILMVAVLLFAPGGIASAFSARFGRREEIDVPAAPVSAQLLLSTGAPRQTLEVEGLGIAFGGVRAVSDLSARMQSGQVTSIIGPNGAGKTTVLNMICGFYRPQSGSVRLGDEELAGKPAHQIARAGIARTFQTPQLFDRMSVLENLLVAMQRGELGSPLTDVASSRTSAQAQTARALLNYVGYRGKHRATRRRPAAHRQAAAGNRARARATSKNPDARRAGRGTEPLRQAAPGEAAAAHRGCGDRRRPDRARHEPRHGDLGPYRRARRRQEHRAGTPRRRTQRSRSRRGVSGRCPFRHASARARLAPGRRRATCRAPAHRRLWRGIGVEERGSAVERRRDRRRPRRERRRQVDADALVVGIAAAGRRNAAARGHRDHDIRRTPGRRPRDSYWCPKGGRYFPRLSVLDNVRLGRLHAQRCNRRGSQRNGRAVSVDRAAQGTAGRDSCPAASSRCSRSRAG